MRSSFVSPRWEFLNAGRSNTPLLMIRAACRTTSLSVLSLLSTYGPPLPTRQPPLLVFSIALNFFSTLLFSTSSLATYIGSMALGNSALGLHDMQDFISTCTCSFYWFLHKISDADSCSRVYSTKRLARRGDIHYSGEKSNVTHTHRLIYTLWCFDVWVKASSSRFWCVLSRWPSFWSTPNLFTWYYWI